MTLADVIVDRVEVQATGVDVDQPLTGVSPPAHLVVEVSFHDAADQAVSGTRVTGALHGDLAIAEGVAVGPGRWRLEVPAVMLEADFELAVRVDGDRRRSPIAVVRGRNARFTPRSGGFGGLLMHQLGRAGSTMMMQLLAGHPAVAVFDHYPLETRPGLAWMHSLAVLAGTQTIAPGDEPFFDEVDTTTANPYVSDYFLGADAVATEHRGGFDRLRSVVAELVEDTYRQRTPDAVFFAEKFRIESAFAARTQQTTLATWPESRQIILVRDPRDLLCSRLSFNQQRAEASFDLDLDDDAVTGAPTIVHHLRLAARQLEAFPDAVLVRYEDLVERPVATATRVFASLGLDHGFATVRDAVSSAVAARSDRHVTSVSAAASIGRWRDELPADAASHLVRELADELDAFGYER